MGFILKNNQGLIITRLTDVGRRKISQGKFKVKYFQIGDSEVDYDAYDKIGFFNGMVLEPMQNSQNNTGIPDSTKNGVKYPYYYSEYSGNTYGIPIQSSTVENIFNTAVPIGFFTKDTTCADGSPKLKPNLSSEYARNSNLRFSTINGAASFAAVSQSCTGGNSTTPVAQDYVYVYMNNLATTSLCNCFSSSTPVLAYKVSSVNGSTINIDRNLPNFNNFTNTTGAAKPIFYYKSFSSYDLTTPINSWANSTNNFGSVCSPEDGLVKIWNMNIVWSENIAGQSNINFNYKTFPSSKFLGVKEYFGYSSNEGQTDTSSTFYYNSYGEKIIVEPKDQKAIAIVHYSNNTLINWYGEKFADEPYDPTNPGQTGQARNFKVSLPWLMWHKNEYPCSSGAVFYIDPPGFDSHDLLKAYHIQSNKNSDMNSPGIRYYHLYDTNESYTDGPPNRVGKVFPDDKIIIFDDEEIVAAMSYASNRNYTLPAPRLSLTGVTDGLLENQTDCVWVTYLFDSNGVWDGMHCNYYSKICKSTTGCTNLDEDIIVSFGGDFNCMSQPTTLFIPGWYTKNFYILVQKTNSQSRPTSTGWKIINFTSQLTSNVNGFISVNSLIQKNFIITKSSYNNASFYDINTYLTIPTTNNNTGKIQFGEEYFFYGLLETDIEATIYEMKYNINLSDSEFVKSSNPTWSLGKKTLMTDIGIYDDENELLIYSKFQTPQLREGSQQVVVKLDF